MKSSKPQVHREHSRGNMSAKPLWFPKPLRNESLSRASLLKFYLEVDIHPNRNAITSFPETVEPQGGGGGAPPQPPPPLSCPLAQLLMQPKLRLCA